MYKIAAITGGINAPSSRYRIRVITDSLNEAGICLKEICPATSRYPPKSNFLRPFWLFAALLERLSFIQKSLGYDAVILQKELISTIPTIEKLLPGNKILDVDDAIYLHRGGLAARNAASASLGVVCGNEVLAENFSKWNSSVEIIPTGVNVNQMKINTHRLDCSERRTVGWIGTPGNLKYLDDISQSLLTAIKQNPNFELRVLTKSYNDIPNSLAPHVKFVKWYPGIEFDEMPNWSVGVMPLPNNEWTRGKCSFKLLQYLSAGIPAIVSPVGMNVDVMTKGPVGYLADNSREWTESLISMLSDDRLNFEMGLEARKVAERFYSHIVIAQMWRKVLDKWL
ncbi:glycosyltransferase [Halomonas sp. LR5S13]|uniref:glycosyltransferase n=1 Tax=Halomonas rhizosphaerae TaxID=3043296 RepID=UPI0024A86514|nr:glycosyltransferase [Halomonas rhizosphaerae]MDI5920992.1 glycosyltransferase [Halomonas rhizosphaerae]